jgi:large subunit ribosomal protein L22
MTGLKTNERPGTRAVLRNFHMSASKARQVLDLIRDEEVGRAAETLRATERSAATVVAKVLASAVANAAHNDGEDPEDLYVSACYADEGATLKRWRPRARGRATRIRKRSCHITIIVSRLPDERLARRRAQRDAQSGGRSRRVAESRRRADLAGRLSRRRAAQESAAEAVEPVDEELADLELADVEIDAVDDTEGELVEVDEVDEVEGELAEGDEAGEIEDVAGDAEVAPVDEDADVAADHDEEEGE